MRIKTETKEEKFNRLYKKYREMVYGSFNKYTMIDNRKDLVQDYWLDIWNRIDNIKDEYEGYQMKLWIKTIAINKIRALNANKRKGYNTPLIGELNEDLNLIDVIPNENASNPFSELIECNIRNNRKSLRID